MDSGFAIVTQVLPVIVFMGSLFAVLFHLGVIQRVVAALAWVMMRTMRTSGAESLAAAAEIFVGMVEAPLLVRPYLERMTRSELFALMTTGMATVAGSVMVAYAGMLGADYAGHLLTASFLAAPGGLLLAKVMIPETGTPLTAGSRGADIEDAAVERVRRGGERRDRGAAARRLRGRDADRVRRAGRARQRRARGARRSRRDREPELPGHPRAACSRRSRG